MPTLQAFIALENTFAASMHAKWRTVAESLISEVMPLMQDRRWGDAHALADKLSMKGVVADNRKKFQELGASAILFGAHHVSGSLKTTSFMQGKPLPGELTNAINQLSLSIETNAADQVRKQLHLLIDMYEKTDGLTPISKSGNPYHDADGKFASAPGGGGHTIFHYTTEEGEKGIRESGSIRPGPGLFGTAAYFTESQTGAGGRSQSGKRLEFTVSPDAHVLEMTKAKVDDWFEQHASPDEKANDDISATMTRMGVDAIRMHRSTDTWWLVANQSHVKLKKGVKRTLYVNRPLLNWKDLQAWALGQGFGSMQRPEDLHVTIAYSKMPMDVANVQPLQDEVVSVGGHRTVEIFGKATVLTLQDDDLLHRWEQLRNHGAGWSHSGYRPHVTLSWNREHPDLAEIAPYAGPLHFGPEVFAEIDDDWQDDHKEMLLKAEQTLADQLNAAVLGNGKMAMNVGANLTTSRLVSLGFLAQAVDAGYDEYQVNEVLDKRTCTVCRYMHGRTFKVQNEYGRLLQTLSTTDPNELKSLAPWPKNSKAGLATLNELDEDEMQAQGFASPPFHPGCRGVLTLKGTVEPEIDLKGLFPGQDDQPSVWDMMTSKPITAAITEAEAAASSAAAITPYPGLAKVWDAVEVEDLKWRRFQVTDPKLQYAVNQAFEAGEYDLVDHAIDLFENGKKGLASEILTPWL